MDSKKIRVEVVYALPDRQRLIALELEPGSTIETAILHSGLLAEFPSIDLTQDKVGVFSRQRELQDVLKDGDRVEIYRSLILDPKEARRAKAKQFKKKDSKLG